MNKLREIRLQKGITQFELAKYINIHPQRISEYENGKIDLRFGQMVRAAKFLNVNLGALANCEEGNSHESITPV